MHSTTKYFGGHSDVLGGALVFARRDRVLRRRRASPPHHRRGAVAVQRLADAARMPLAAGADGAALRECAQARRFLPRIRRSNGSTTRVWTRHSRPCDRRAADVRLWRDAEHRGARRPRTTLAVGRQTAAVHQCDLAGRLRVAGRASRVGRRAESGVAAEPVADLGRLEHVDDLIADFAQALAAGRVPARSAVQARLEACRRARRCPTNDQSPGCRCSPSTPTAPAAAAHPFLQQLDRDQVRRSHECHVAVARRTVDRDAHRLQVRARRVDVLDPEREVAEIARARRSPRPSPSSM